MLDRTLPGIQGLKHVVVLMMENRSFDHMLGALRGRNPAIDGDVGGRLCKPHWGYLSVSS
jgi:phospholipase C